MHIPTPCMMILCDAFPGCYFRSVCCCHWALLVRKRNFLCFFVVLSMKRAPRVSQSPALWVSGSAGWGFPALWPQKKSDLRWPSTSAVMQTDGGVAERAFWRQFWFCGKSFTPGSSRICPQGFVAFFFFFPSFLRVLLVQRVGWGAGMSSQGTWSIPQEYLASSLLQANPPSSFPSQHKLGCVLSWFWSWFWSWFPFQTSSWAQSHQGVCQLELFPDRLGPGTGKSFCLEPLAQHQQSPFCEFWACSGEELQRFG